jgi:hypothetical protein
MTGLELCRRIADAVIAVYESENLGPFLRDDRPDHAHGPTLAVLQTLEAAGAGFFIESEGRPVSPADIRDQRGLFEDFDRR